MVIFNSKNIMNSYEGSFYEIINSIENQKEKKRLIKAFNFASKAHKGQKRQSGEDYITHPLSVGITLWNKFKDYDLFISGLLHDTVEDCELIKIKDIYEIFGENVGYLVDSVTNNEKYFFNSDYYFEEPKDKVLFGGIINIGCILLKLSDREHNLATLSHMSNKKQIKKSFESQALYLPLINILGFKDDNSSVQKTEDRFKKHIKKYNIKNYKELKNNLLNTCFQDFSEEMFKTVYRNSQHVLWEIEDKIFFNELIESGWFDNKHINIVNIEQESSGLFKISFHYKGGVIIDNILNKVNISKKSFIG